MDDDVLQVQSPGGHIGMVSSVSHGWSSSPSGSGGCWSLGARGLNITWDNDLRHWSWVATILKLMLVVIVFRGGVVRGQNTNFSFPAFKEMNENISIDGNTIFNSSTSSYQMNLPKFMDSCGRIMYKYPVQMIDKGGSGAVASFTTSFTISFQTENPKAATCADGMAFTFAAARGLSQENKDRSGAGFCLLDFNNSTDRVFAVEFDSYQNVESPWFDPNGSTASHIGVDLNNQSLSTTSLCSLDTTSSFMSSFCEVSTPDGCITGFCGDKGIFTAWIDYDSSYKTLEVRIREKVSFDDANKPVDAAIRVGGLTLDHVFIENMYVGFSSSTGTFQETHQLHSWRFETTGMTSPKDPPAPSPSPTGSPPMPSPAPSPPATPSPESGSGFSTSVVAGIIGGVVSSALTGIFLFYFVRYKLRSKNTTGGQESQVPQAGVDGPLLIAGQNLETVESAAASHPMRNINLVINMPVVFVADFVKKFL